MPHDDHFIQLDGLSEEVRRRLEVCVLAGNLHCVLHVVVVGLRQLDSWKEVGDDALEQRDIMGQELAQVDVNDGPEHQDLLVLVGVPALQVGGRTEHGHDCAHPVVVVVLARQLLGAKLVALDDLLRAVPCLKVAVGE